MIPNTYFERYAYSKRFIDEIIVDNTFLSVVIPVFKEDNLIATLESLDNCEPTTFPVEVILVINHPEDATQEVKELSESVSEEINVFRSRKKSDFITFHLIKAYDLPKKQAGVGLARKIGMDEASYRFNTNQRDGIIVCFDADSICESNYLKSIESHFLKNPLSVGSSIHFEHPIHKEGESNLPIILYELHLRYYVQGLKYAQYPFAYHTIGSSMAVKSSVYQKQGGMNQRKAGEDFYFLHKIIPLGNFTNINSTKVIPSPRISDRVPFGTGRAMGEYEMDQKDLTSSYNFLIFKELKSFILQIEDDCFPSNCSQSIQHFITANNFEDSITKIRQQSKNKAHLRDRFFQWFNGFRVLKCVHFLRDHYYPNQALETGVMNLFSEIEELKKYSKELSAEKQLVIMRKYERSL
ncbi:glycosyltransferase family 2 protein [Marivirga sp. S37H4]|uniref:Glycosyltransferase family 2 protein n=1 Tax=Marivirga aurantiaca TaxID=2802615 RepID=A0A935C631_9BACT|nr:glycosyltransferase family A protein [Marivirga aurantiaca]MBK6264221.1 glycosyltransferase family 2 protein [Marivirga aurantiaca]